MQNVVALKYVVYLSILFYIFHSITKDKIVNHITIEYLSSSKYKQSFILRNRFAVMFRNSKQFEVKVKLF